MLKEDIVGIIGAVVSSFFAAFGFLWQIGFLQLVFTFLAGAFSTYVVQHRLQIESERRKIRRENAVLMRDSVYGPLFNNIGVILNDVLAGRETDYKVFNRLDSVMGHYLFFAVDRDLREDLDELLDMVNKYFSIRRAFDAMLHDVARKKVQDAHKVDVGFDSSGAILRLLKSTTMVDATNLRDLIFHGVTPKDFVTKAIRRWGENVSVEVSIGGKRSSGLTEFSELYKAVLSEIEKRPLYLDERQGRRRVVEQLERFLERLKPLVKVE